MHPKRIEEMTLNAWPALRTHTHNGWLLRFADGFTKRSNSVSALYSEPSIDLQEMIGNCERSYTSAGLDAIFKITPFNPPELDGALEERGYAVLDRTSLKVLHTLDHLEPPTHMEVNIEEYISERWMDELTEITGLSEKNRGIKRKLFDRPVISYAFVTLYEGGIPAACGIGALENGIVGLYDIVTAPVFRQRGFATQVLLHILQWAQTKGATGSYLQVVQGNTAANRLYDKLMYRELYCYWYRSKPMV